MNNLTPASIALLAKIAFLVAAVTDALALIPMLSPRIGSKLFGGDSSRSTPRNRFAMNLAAALMAGWTAILFWGACQPIERRDVLLIVVCPSIMGIIAASIVAVRGGVIEGRRLVPLWVHLALLSTLCIWAYLLSSSITQ